jgi:tRNA1(Val) A37 N6-methylase TrmN6
MAALAEAGLPVVRLRFVHAKTNEPAYAVLTESIPDSRRPLVVEPPLIVHAVNGGYTPDLDDVLTGRVVP